VDATAGFDVAVPEDVRAVAVLCHPHPDHGGDRHNAVVAALFGALPAGGVAALRFDFRRPVGDGLGRAVEDVEAALDAAAERVPDVPVVLCGYSFGAVAALAALGVRPDVSRLAVVAPPLALLPATAPPAVPVLVLVPAHDQFSPPAAVEPVVAEWPDADMEVVESADHFLAGRTAWVADRIVSWLS
jgi:alpha/beta superfamily hydrolase